MDKSEVLAKLEQALTTQYQDITESGLTEQDVATVATWTGGLRYTNYKVDQYSVVNQPGPNNTRWFQVVLTKALHEKLNRAPKGIVGILPIHDEDYENRLYRQVRS